MKRCIILLCLQSLQLTVQASGYAMVCALLRQYRRPITVLELNQRGVQYSYQLSRRFKGTYVALMHEGIGDACQAIESQGITNMVAAEFPSAAVDNLKDMGACEHFDVVIVHAIEKIIDGRVEALRTALGLGDYVLIDMPDTWYAESERMLENSMVQTQSNGSRRRWVLFAPARKTLARSRWISTKKTQAYLEYSIESTFDKKVLRKGPDHITSTWIPGINLITFLMLKGRYPTNAMMCAEFEKLRDINHNDLVLGNLIVQGNRLCPIDFNDRRRKSNQRACIAAALKIFHSNKRFSDPREVLYCYAHRLSRS